MSETVKSDDEDAVFVLLPKGYIVSILRENDLMSLDDAGEFANAIEAMIDKVITAKLAELGR